MNLTPYDMATSIIKAVYKASAVSTYFDFTRRGNVVQLKCSTNLPSTADGATMDTIPVGFRPVVTTDYVVFATSGTKLGMIRLNSNGNVTPVFGAYTASSNSRFSITYICD